MAMIRNSPVGYGTPATMRNNRFTQIVIWAVVLGMVLSMAIVAATLIG